MTDGHSLRNLDAKVHYWIKGERRTLHLGPISSIDAAKGGLRSAYDEATHQGGEDINVEFTRNGDVVVYSAKVPRPA